MKLYDLMTLFNDTNEQREWLSTMSRKTASRLAVVQALYQYGVTGSDPNLIIDEFITYRKGEQIDDVKIVPFKEEMFRDLFKAIIRQQNELSLIVSSELDKKVHDYALGTMILIILECAVYELKENPKLHKNIIISEYVDIARAFFWGNEPKMINAVLEKLAARLRGDLAV